MNVILCGCWGRVKGYLHDLFILLKDFQSMSMMISIYIHIIKLLIITIEKQIDINIVY